MRWNDSSSRLEIDPDGRYPSEGFRHVEALALRILRVLPTASVSRTRDVIQIDEMTEDNDGVVILVTREAIELRLPDVEWTAGSYGPSVSSRLWKRVDEKSLTDAALQQLIGAAKAVRQDEFIVCRYCGVATPVELRHDDLCHGCAERHLEIIH